MSRLIDADASISFVDAGHLRNPLELTWSDNDVVDMIESRPTIDAVPVVRCKDCRWWSKDEPDDEYGYCYNGKIIGSTKENWYCADGKRKEKTHE